MMLQIYTKVMNDMFDVTAIGKRIKEVRGNMKQEECAIKLGISRAALSSYENGSRTMDIEILYKFCELFNVSTDYLLGRTPHSTINEDTQNALKITGLSEKALENIKVLCGTSPTMWTNLSHKAVMFMLESEHLTEIARALGYTDTYNKVLDPSPELTMKLFKYADTEYDIEHLALSAIAQTGFEDFIISSMKKAVNQIYDDYRKELENGKH